MENFNYTPPLPPDRPESLPASRPGRERTLLRPAVVIIGAVGVIIAIALVLSVV